MNLISLLIHAGCKTTNNTTRVTQFIQTNKSINMTIKSLFLSVVCFGLILISDSCDTNDPPTPVTLETDHFILISNTQLSTSDENTAVLNKAESLYSQILDIVGENREPQNKITIRMEGNFTAKGPYFDNLGIHLYRYSVEEDGYLGALAHEMGHAFHEDYYIQYDPYQWTNYPYLDEGFAEYIAQLIDPAKTWFPWYGFNEYAVVGDLILSDNTIPHSILRAQHFELNDKCHIQAYTLRCSWIRYIDETYGRTALLNISYTAEEPTLDFFSEQFGEDLATVDANWASWALDKYNNTPDASATSVAFRERTSWYNYCEY